MSDIICAECNATVPDESGFCPECGFPFTPDNSSEAGAPEAAVPPESAEADAPVEPAEPAPPQTVVTTPLDVILRSIDSIRAEMKELQTQVDNSGRGLHAQTMQAAENSQKSLAEVTARLEAVTAVQNSILATLQAEDDSKKKGGLIAAFYKTLNSPNSMFEYMFYICIVQIIFVVVILFVAAYIVTLVR